MTTSEIQAVVLLRRPTAVVRGHVGVEGLPDFLGGSVRGEPQGMPISGSPSRPPFARYRMSRPSSTWSFPSTGPIAATRVNPATARRSATQSRIAATGRPARPVDRRAAMRPER